MLSYIIKLYFIFVIIVPALAPCDSINASLEALGPSAYAYGTAEMTYYANVPPKDADSVSNLWSCSQLISTALVFRLHEEGILNVDDKVSTYFDWWTSNISDPRANVTLRTLQAQIAGFGDYICEAVTSEECAISIYENAYATYDQGFFGTKNMGSYDHPSPGEVKVGSHFHYAESNWYLVTAVLEKVLGKPFEEIWKEKMAKAVGMDTSRCYWKSYLGAEFPIDSGVDLLCSLREYAKFLEQYFNRKYISIASTDAMETPHNLNTITINPFPTNDEAFGIGLWLSSCKPDKDVPCTFGHSMGIEGAYPGIDRKNGFWAMLQRNGGLDLMSSVTTRTELPKLINATQEWFSGTKSEPCLEECTNAQFMKDTCSSTTSENKNFVAQLLDSYTWILVLFIILLLLIGIGITVYYFGACQCSCIKSTKEAREINNPDASETGKSNCDYVLLKE